MMIRYNNPRVRVAGEEFPQKKELFPFPHWGVEGWAGAIAIGATVAAGAATAYSANKSASAQKQASVQAAQSQQNANNLNYQMFEQAHGSNGNAVLPMYLTNPNGTPFEASLGSDLTKAYGDTAMPLSTFQDATAKLAPGQAGSVDFANNIFNGGVTNKMLTNAQPVQAARLATARSSSMDALHKTLDQIDEQQASRGYVGDSYGSRLLSFQAAKSAGDAIGGANLENAQQTADIRNYGDVTLPLNNITLPYSLAQTAGQNAFLPNDLYLQSIGQRMQPFNMLKIGYTGPFQYQPLPTPGPGAFSGGANIASALGGSMSGLSGSAMQYVMQQQNNSNANAQLAQILAARNNGGTPTAASYNPYDTVPPAGDPNGATPLGYDLANGGYDLSGGGSSVAFDPSSVGSAGEFVGQ